MTDKNSELNKFSDELKWNTIDTSEFPWGGVTESGFLTLEVLDSKEIKTVDLLNPRKRKQQENEEINENEKETKQEEKKENKQSQYHEKLINPWTIKKKPHKKKQKQKTKQKQKQKQKQQNKEKTKRKNKGDQKQKIKKVNIEAWESLGLNQQILDNLSSLGFKAPLPIQAKCVPPAIKYHSDIAGAAETGSGKTFAYSLPIIHQIIEKLTKYGHYRDLNAYKKWKSSSPLQALILCPTRELAVQVQKEIEKILKNTFLRVISVIGGISVLKQDRLIGYRPDIVVATPGRYWEMVQNGSKYLSDLSGLCFFVVDEADRMVQVSRFKEMKLIVDLIKQSQNDNPNRKIFGERQTFVFSATLTFLSDNSKRPERGKKKLLRKKANEKKNQKMKGKKRSNSVSDSISGSDSEQEPRLDEESVSDSENNWKTRKGEGNQIIDYISSRLKFLNKLEVIDLTRKQVLVEGLSEYKCTCLNTEKDLMLYYFLAYHRPGRTLVFTNTIDQIRRLVPILRELKLNVWPLHASMQQRQRHKNLERFESLKDSVLVTTDISARGLHIPNVSSVVHFQFPKNPEIYVHRCGRTARVGTTGVSLSILGPFDIKFYNKTINRLNQKQLQKFKKNPDSEFQEHELQIVELPIDKTIYSQLRKRVKLARKITKVEHQKSKEMFDRDWEKRTAAALDIILSDEEDSDEDSMTDEEEIVQERKKFQANRDLRNWKKDLDYLLNRPLLLKFSQREFDKLL
ncbi:atp-dependent RNA helicase ddx24 [Anaeramoeba flamelloides]|uniref:ATP-dependent RNA helicase n=1 Tax=Anaeramoeba flamelloides TaxID=1746091 RepID=A0ABQ8XBD9_9EUKA|nr:atp-dependent RNA helicase ddx24 [Anaeramoeba flamelloides]